MASLINPCSVLRLVLLRSSSPPLKISGFVHDVIWMWRCGEIKKACGHFFPPFVSMKLFPEMHYLQSPLIPKRCFPSVMRFGIFFLHLDHKKLSYDDLKVSDNAARFQEASVYALHAAAGDVFIS